MNESVNRPLPSLPGALTMNCDMHHKLRVGGKIAGTRKVDPMMTVPVDET